jgi:hypothetical protein
MSMVAMDENLDGKLTADEIRKSAFDTLPLAPEQMVEARISEVMQADTNRDGVVDVAEMREYAAKKAPRPPANAEAVAYLSALTATGRLEASTLEHKAREAFDVVDLDHDLRISAEEYETMTKAFEPVSRPQPIPRAEPVCGLPAISKEAHAVAYGTYEGVTYSDVAVAGQDEETRTATVVIEDGSEPLYVILSSYRPMIWKLEGAVSRVERLVLTNSMGSDESRSGVTGIPREKVTFTGTCLPNFTNTKSEIETNLIRGSLSRSLGRPVVGIAASYATYRVSLPSMKLESLDRSSRSAANVPAGWDRAIAVTYAPGGLAHFEESSVVAERKPERYEVMPARMGIAQLVAEGSLQRLGGDDYKIVAPIRRFPAHLNGGFAVRFLLSSGVPMPAGSPGHSCVVKEETGEPVGGTCLGLKLPTVIQQPQAAAPPAAIKQ